MYKEGGRTEYCSRRDALSQVPLPDRLADVARTLRHQVDIERVERLGNPARVERRDKTVSLLSNNPRFSGVVPAFHERGPSLLEPLVKRGGFDDCTDDWAMLDARLHDAPVRFPKRGDGITLSL
jgi:hypothetical protein